MRRVSAFEQVSLDGFFVDGKGDMSWAHKQDPEWTSFTGSNASAAGALLFGRGPSTTATSFCPTSRWRERSPPRIAAFSHELPVFRTELRDSLL